MIASSDEELHIGRLGDDALLGQRFLAFAEKGSTCVPNVPALEKLLSDCAASLLDSEKENWRNLSLKLFQYCKSINVAAQMFLSSLDLNTQPGDEEKDILESTLTQVEGDVVVEQQNLEPERMI